MMSDCESGMSLLQESMFQPSSPTRRRESTPLLEKIKTDVTIAQARLAAALEGRKEEIKPPKPKDEPPIMKYITTQVHIYYSSLHLFSLCFTLEYLHVLPGSLF